MIERENMKRMGAQEKIRRKKHGEREIMRDLYG